VRGRAFVKANMGKREDRAVGDFVGEVHESVQTWLMEPVKGFRTGRGSLKHDVGPCTIKKQFPVYNRESVGV
jgi:hypothetical protein